MKRLQNGSVHVLGTLGGFMGRCRLSNLDYGNLTESAIKANIRLASFIKSMPFELCKDSGDLKNFPKTWKILLWRLVIIVVYTYAFYETGTLINEIVNHGFTAQLFMVILYFAIHLMNVLFYSVLLTSRPEDFVYAYKSLENMVNMERSRIDGSKIWTSMPLSTFCVIYFIIALLVIFAPAAVCIYLINPNRPVYLFSLLPVMLQERWDVYIGGAVFEAAFYYWSFSVLVLHFNYWCGMVFQMLQWLNAMLRPLGGIGSPRYFLQTWKKNRKRYNDMFSLVQIHNACFRHFLCGYNGVTSTVILLFLFCSLRAYGIVQWYIYIIYPLFAFFGLFLFIICHPLMFMWKRKSGKFLEYWRAMSYRTNTPLGKQEQMLISRELRCMRHIVCEFSSFGHISAGTYDILVRDIFSHLLLLLYY